MRPRISSLTVCSYATEILSERRNPITQVTPARTTGFVRRPIPDLDLDAVGVNDLRTAGAPVAITSPGSSVIG